MMPGLLITATAGCSLQAAAWQLGTSGMQSWGMLTLPRRGAGRDLEGSFVNTQIATRSLWEDEGC